MSTDPGIGAANLLGQQSAFQAVIGRGRATGDRAREAAEEFVAVALVEPILRELRESSDAAPPFAPTRGEKQFRALLDAQLSREIARASRFPLVDRLVSDLRRVTDRKGGTS